MENIFDEANFGAETEVSSQTIDWGKVGDFILGTFVRARHNVDTQFGKNSIYEMVAEKGQFHKLTKKVPASSPTQLNKGDTYAIWGRNDIFNGQMNNMRPGQVIKLFFAEEKDTKMGQSKIVKIYAPRNNENKPLMNDEWLNEQGIVGGDMA